MKKKVLLILAVLLMCVFGALMGNAAANPKTAPVLKETTCMEQGGKIYINVLFQSAKGEKYRVYRRDDGSKSYKKLGDITTKNASGVFKDTTVKKNKVYYYTIRRVYNKNKSLSKYDATGIIASSLDTKPQVVSHTTMQATVRFYTVPQASYYVLYRKAPGEAWRQLKKFAVSDAKYLEYTDIYYKTLTTAAEKKHLINDTFIDPTANPFRYEVRAITTNSTKKYIARSLYYQDGACTVGAPALSSVDVKSSKATVRWAGVPVAKSYNIYAKTTKNSTWQKLGSVNTNGKNIQNATVKITRNYTFYTVKAFANVHGVLTAGDYEKEFYIGKRNLKNKKALFLGDSIALGRPYKGDSLVYFNYAKRVEQMLGMRCDNISITASTISDNYQSIGKTSILTDQLRQVYVGEAPNIPTGFPVTTCLTNAWQYDYIVIQGGTNDYNASIPFGEPDSKDITTLNGALNKIKVYINALNAVRRSKGMANIKVIVIDIMYALRCGGDYQHVRCRQTTPNKLGLTAEDYKNAIRENMAQSDFPVHFISSDSVINEKNCLTESADNLHFTKIGAGKMGKLIADNILYWNLY
ncbi:MAG: hypothetical protein IJG23_05900 [Clostridia bacterium]|nr:hypothetical protein [Clostridia bacterium]